MDSHKPFLNISICPCQKRVVPLSLWKYQCSKEIWWSSCFLFETNPLIATFRQHHLPNSTCRVARPVASSLLGEVDRSKDTSAASEFGSGGEGWSHSQMRTMVLEYLPTCTLKVSKNDPNVGKYSTHGASGINKEYWWMTPYWPLLEHVKTC